jgi:molybdopterin synthase catalytic subunit
MAVQSTDGPDIPSGEGKAVARDRVRVGSDPIDPGSLLDEVRDPRAGAVVLFCGTVRDHSEGKLGVTHLEYEAYGEVVEAKIAELVAEARRRWPLERVAVEHAVGGLAVGETSVAVAVSSGHRNEAFAAGRFLIDRLKETAPIWKKEHWEGGAEWVREGHHSDDGEEAPA